MHFASYTVDRFKNCLTEGGKSLTLTRTAPRVLLSVELNFSAGPLDETARAVHTSHRLYDISSQCRVVSRSRSDLQIFMDFSAVQGVVEIRPDS